MAFAYHNLIHDCLTWLYFTCYYPSQLGIIYISVRDEFRSGGWSLLPEFFFPIAYTKINWFCPHITCFLPMARTPMGINDSNGCPFSRLIQIIYAHLSSFFISILRVLISFYRWLSFIKSVFSRVESISQLILEESLFFMISLLYVCLSGSNILWNFPLPNNSLRSWRNFPFLFPPHPVF